MMNNFLDFMVILFAIMILSYGLYSPAKIAGEYFLKSLAGFGCGLMILTAGFLLWMVWVVLPQ